MQAITFRLFFLFVILGPSYLKGQPYISRSQAKEDIDFLVRTIKAVHYNPHLFISAVDFTKQVLALRTSIGDSISIQVLMLKLYTLCGLLNDGHTGPVLTQSVIEQELEKRLLLPLLWGTEGHKVYAIKNLSDVAVLPQGSRILSINDRDIDSLFYQMLSYYGGTAAFKRDVSERLMSYFLFLQGIRPPFKIVYQDGEGQKVGFVDTGISFSTALSASIPSITEPPFSFRVIDDKMGYIDFVAMEGRQAFRHFLDSCFRVMRHYGIQTLAVDLRKNSGGNSLLADELISYITTRQYTLWGGRYWKISDQYKTHLREEGNTASEYLKQVTSSIWHASGKKLRTPMKRDTLFTGKVYLLTGPFTFSSANMLADGAKHFRLATLIGEPTGEATSDFGETYSFQLPNSKIDMQCSSSFDIGANSDRNHHKPVQPDILIKTTIQQRIKGVDPVMDYLRKSVK